MATHTSRRLFFLVTPGSSTAFLYQTRTLTSPTYPVRSTIARRFQHQRPATTHALEEHHESAKTRSIDTAPNQKFSSQYPSAIDVTEERDGNEDIPSTETFGDNSHSSPKQPTPFAESENDRPKRISYLRKIGAAHRKLDSTSDEPGLHSKPSTLTSGERSTFRGLLSNSSGPNNSETGYERGNLESDSGPAQPSRRDVDSLLNLFDSVLRRLQSTDTSPPEDGHTSRDTSSSVTAGTDESSAPAETDVIEDLRTIRLSDLAGGQLAHPHMEQEVTMIEAIGIIIKREYSEIEDALLKAIQEGKGDVGVWNICRERVFGMLSHLDAAAPIGRLDGNSNSSGSLYGAKLPPRSTGPLSIPPLVPVWPLVARLYPDCLLLVFRLLGTHFPDSHLITQFHSAVKEKGRLSTFLGTSKPLYEEMIYFSWSKLRDLPGVISLLRDMDNAGLEPSRRIRYLLEDIALEYKQNKKYGMTPFWGLPSNQRAIAELVGPGGWMDTLFPNDETPQPTKITLPFSPV